MLHMIVNTHNPESCSFRSEEHGEVLIGAFEKFIAAVDERDDLDLRGAWVNNACHQVFALVDAPDAHVFDEVMIETGLIGRTRTRVLAVMTADEALEKFGS